ncbi:hypothetical protein Rhopal_005084-T1 [Rhodotorula paludigena]|uniref:Uncharacterized protein n=1 Tax=Rhodotorula paludigena TaxID=86838 RepID=A0AAV5GHD6_9BASI|nr:hypothetical protein Rhopal_005084-T1 [Rhodotorula paludigena]
MAPVLSRSSPRASPYSRPSSSSASRTVYRISPLIFKGIAKEDAGSTVASSDDQPKSRKRPLDDDESTFSVSPDASTTAQLAASRPVKRIKQTIFNPIIVTIPREQVLDFVFALLYPATAKASAAHARASRKRGRHSHDNNTAAPTPPSKLAHLATATRASIPDCTPSSKTLQQPTHLDAPAALPAKDDPGALEEAPHRNPDCHALERNCARVLITSTEEVCNFRSRLRLGNCEDTFLNCDNMRAGRKQPLIALGDIELTLTDVTTEDQVDHFCDSLTFFVRTGNRNFLPPSLVSHVDALSSRRMGSAPFRLVASAV